MYQQPRSHLYFTEPPNFDELCQVTVKIPATRDQTKPRSLQPQIMKCRELIFTEPDILASPSMDNETSVNIILLNSLYRSGKLQQRFQRMGIHAEEPRPVSAPELQFCLNYTMLAKLAPAWNKAGDCLVQGRDFLVSRQKLNAVEYQLSVNELEMFMSLRAHVIRLPPLQLSDLDLPKPVLYEFLATRQKIDEFSIQRQWCHILPSMKKGQIVSVSHQLPPDCPYKSYRELKRFWKNTYGYRLPEDDTNMIYYQVYFRPLGGTLFTYPECCLRPRAQMSLPRPDEDTIILGFLSDLHSKMPSICGSKVRFSTLANYTSCELVNSDRVEEITENCQPNLSHHRPASWRPGVNIASQPAPETSLTNSTRQEMSLTQPQTLPEINRPIYPMQPSSVRSTSTQPNSPQKAETPQVTQSKPELQNTSTKIIPRFKPSFKTKPPQSHAAQKQSSGSRTVPNFKPIKPVHNPPVPVHSHEVLQPKPKRAQQRPIFQIQADLPQQTMRPSFNTAVKSTPKFTPKLPKPIPPAVKGTPKTKRTTPSTPKQKPAKAPSTPKLNHNYSLSDSGYGSSLLCSPFPSNPGTHLLPLSQDVIPPTPSTPILKRPADPTGTPVTKKPRAKPKVQENVDVEAMARSNTLSKVNTITLSTWLKERGVSCKSKDKKGELVEKTLHYLNLLQTAEQ